MTEADLVRKIFRLTISEGAGAYQIASILNKEGFRTHGGAEFQSNHILRILKNSIYCGFLKNGEATSDRIESLRIIDDHDFAMAQEILRQRAHKSDEKRTIALHNKGKALLSGNIFCAHCGCRLTTSRYVEEYRKQDGTEVCTEYVRYICHHRSRRLNDCDGATTYNAEKIDEAVIDVMRSLFAKITGCPQEEKIRSAYKKMMAENHHLQQKTEMELEKNRKQLAKLRLEIGKVLEGNSIYSEEDLASALNTVKAKITEGEAILEKLQDEDAQKKAMCDNMIPAYQQFRSWAEEFENASLETKKMIACQLFTRVEIGKGYKVHIELNMTYRQFLEDWCSGTVIEAIAG